MSSLRIVEVENQLIFASRATIAVNLLNVDEVLRAGRSS